MRLFKFVFISVLLFVTALTIATTGQVVLGQGESSPLAGMNFSETTEAYSDGGILEVAIVIEEKEGFVGNESVTARVYNGSLMGPTLHVKPGERMVVNYINMLDEPTNLHFHGLHVSPSGSSDNVFRVVGPGETAKYVIDIPVDHRPGQEWYHAHLHQLTNQQVGDGMSGLIVIEGLEDLLPEPLNSITQRTFAMKAFPPSWQHLPPPSGAYYTINGEINPVVSISPGETQLWRFASIDDGNTFYKIELPGHTFHVIAEDGNPVWEVWDAEQLVLPSGKRYEVLVTGGENGTYPLKMLPYKWDPDIPPNPESTLATVNVQGDAGAATSAPLPSSLVPRNELDLAGLEVDRQRELNFSDDGKGINFFINDKVFSPYRVDQQVNLGDLEEWKLVNLDDGQHTFHIHVNDFQVMSVNGQRYDAHSLEDTVILPAGGEVVVRIPFEDFVGKFVYHCHILEHEDGGMMGTVEVVDPLTPPNYTTEVPPTTQEPQYTNTYPDPPSINKVSSDHDRSVLPHTYTTQSSFSSTEVAVNSAFG